ncbi:MAG: protein phosphatase 2C domain-containing protein [Proteobacteria bacterium]|nr:protein phosphatase 2C domain-containing protein [Pseudomonadota bacterium]
MTRVPWRIAIASDVGTSHLASGTPCQDSALYTLLDTHDGEILVAVVCDGAGSAVHSHVGSKLAAEGIAHQIKTFFELGGQLRGVTRSIVTEWVVATANLVTDRAILDGNSAKDYSSTLLVAILGEDCAIFAQIGDGAMVVSHGEADGWSWIFWPQHGEYANQTVFILSENALDALEFCSAHRPIDEIALFSDGIERLVLHAETKSVNDAFFNQMFVPVRQSATNGEDSTLSAGLQRYLASAPVVARTNDDKTLILATRRPAISVEA